MNSIVGNGLVRWVLDLDAIPPDAEGVRLVFERPFPGWIWFLVIVGAVAFAVWSYSRLAIDRRARIVLSTLRAITVVFAFVLFAQPQLSYPRETVEPDWLVVLLDRTASMRIADVQNGATRVTREEQLTRALENAAPAFTELARDRRLLFLGFAGGTFEIAATRAGEGDASGELLDPVPDDLGDADGWRTALAGSLRQALDRVASRPTTALVVLSDGRSADQIDAGLVRRFREAAVRAITVPLGSDQALGDASVARVEAPTRAFVRDVVPVRVRLDRVGDIDALGALEVELVDEDGTVLDARRVEADDLMENADGSRAVVLTTRREEAGTANWTVRVRGDAPDLLQENDERSLQLEFVDRPLRVLYVDGYPRWEYRYLKNLLVREESIESSVFLVSADRDFAQEGNTPLERLPRTAEEFRPFDLIVIGDLNAGWFSDEQLRLIADQVADRGAGLLLIGGGRSMPRTWGASPLAELLPFRAPFDLETIDGGALVQPTALAEELGVLRLTNEEDGWPAYLSDPATGWSRLRAVQRIEEPQLKPTTEILAESVPETSAERLPIAMRMRYGAGQVVYVTASDTWRWRFGRGETLQERFWIGIARLLSRQSLLNADGGISIAVEPREVVLGSPVRITLRIDDDRLLEQVPETIAIEVRDVDGRVIADLELVRAGDSAEWAVDWFPDRPGIGSIEVVEPLLAAAAGLADPARVTILRPDDELRTPESDHELLARLASETGGSVLPPDELSRLAEPGFLRNREVRIERPVIEAIWSIPAAFLLLVGLLTLEWIGRRMARMI